ncbi:MAG: 16S rRNA (cytosine(1402)-N(4))-methyltransferase RsmH [Candidatus Omnitrophica bacterium]|nr:16S rRNA (cytosine(1402)-N(4))-methyltransferase RsmH [Candidatus Omnitrophota bacterium]
MTARTSSPAWHQPVMVEAVLELLNPRSPAVIVDATVGTGGHSLALLPRLLPHGRLIGIDRDPEALKIAGQRLTEFQPLVRLERGNYRDLPSRLTRLGARPVDGILLDLGVSSLQLDRADRGFSFAREGPLDMRMDPDQDTTAETLVNTLPADDLARLLETLGEERFARRIAQHIVQERRTHPITTTKQLARVMTRAIPAGARHGRLHAATRTFQALRLAVNDELGALTALLAQLPVLLKPGARAVIITFHSLEDRIVKRAFLEGQGRGVWTVLTKKPRRPSAEEAARNPRARSAKLRAVERL